jgi:hypothetical protein
LIWKAKILEFHLLKLARSEDEIAWVDFVPKRLPNLGDTEREFLA